LLTIRCRFNSAQYSSFLFPSAASSAAAAARFPPMAVAGPSQCSSVKSESVASSSSPWSNSRYHGHHPDSSWPDFHLAAAADYSAAAAAAHYSNMTAAATNNYA